MLNFSGNSVFIFGEDFSRNGDVTACGIHSVELGKSTGNSVRLIILPVFKKRLEAAF